MNVTHGDFDDNAVSLPGKFEIFTGADTHFYFHLKAENGEIIAASQGYTTKQSAERGIDAIKRIASHADVIDLSQSQMINKVPPRIWHGVLPDANFFR